MSKPTLLTQIANAQSRLIQTHRVFTHRNWLHEADKWQERLQAAYELLDQAKMYAVLATSKHYDRQTSGQMKTYAHQLLHDGRSKIGRLISDMNVVKGRRARMKTVRITPIEPAPEDTERAKAAADRGEVWAHISYDQ